jgi:hypothetical protein
MLLPSCARAYNGNISSESMYDPGGSPGSENAQKSKFLELDETNSIMTVSSR